MIMLVQRLVTGTAGGSPRDTIGSTKAAVRYSVLVHGGGDTFKPQDGFKLWKGKAKFESHNVGRANETERFVRLFDSLIQVQGRQASTSSVG